MQTIRLKISMIYIFLATVICLANIANSAQIRIKENNPQDCIFIEFTGEIYTTDYDALKRIVSSYISNSNKFRNIELNSSGGDLSTAIKIGRYLRALEFDTNVNNDAQCLSSCVFIYASGLYKIAANSGLIGIHRPFGTSTGWVSQEEATMKYRELSKQIFAYFEEMNIPRSLPEAMLRVPPEQIRMLTFEEASQFGLNGKDPVAQERDDAANAQKYRISRQEYLARRNHALKACSMPSQNGLDMSCYDAILMGR